MKRLCSFLPSFSFSNTLITPTRCSISSPVFSFSRSCSSGKYDVDHTKRLQELQPSEHFLKNLSGNDKLKYEEIRKEIEVFVYMGSFIPRELNDSHWTRLLSVPQVSFRVSFLEHLALKQEREVRDIERKKKREEKYKELLEMELEKFKRGEMGYGPEMYQLVINPTRFRKKINHIQGCKVLRSEIQEVPKLMIDLQNIPNETQKNQGILGRHVQYLISENFDAPNPFPIVFSGFKNNTFYNNWMRKEVGYYNGQYTDQTIMPEITDKSTAEILPKDKEIIYISRHAREVLDGRLRHDAYVLPVTMDAAREALGNARRAKVRAMRLPIQRYVKWQCGPMVLPINNIARILREVSINGGDWESALMNNISKRHFLSEKEREGTIWNSNKRKERKREQRELIQAIRDATGHE